MPKRRSVLLLPVLLSVALSAPSPARADGASGWFESAFGRLPIGSAYAFRGHSGLDREREVVLVAVSNAGFVREVLDEYWDRRHVIETQFRDERTGVVFFEFATDGAYRGVFWYHGPGDGCGWCGGGAVVSTVRLAGDRLSGELRLPAAAEEGHSFEIDLDVPVSGDDHGAPQGAGGGAPGAAFLAYHRALVGDDHAAVRGLLSGERRETWDGAAEAGDTDGFLAFLRGEHPDPVEVTAAYVDGDRALVLYRGTVSGVAVEGEAHLAREEGAWRFEEETSRIAPEG